MNIMITKGQKPLTKAFAVVSYMVSLAKLPIIHDSPLHLKWTARKAPWWHRGMLCTTQSSMAEHCRVGWAGVGGWISGREKEKWNVSGTWHKAKAIQRSCCCAFMGINDDDRSKTERRIYTESYCVCAVKPEAFYQIYLSPNKNQSTRESTRTNGVLVWMNLHPSCDFWDHCKFDDFNCKWGLISPTIQFFFLA